MKKDYEIAEQLKAMFNFPLYSRIGSAKWESPVYVWGKLSDKSQFCELLKAFKPSTDFIEVGNDKKRIESPFRVTIENPCKYARFVSVSWQSGEYNISAKLPESLLSDFLTPTKRNLYDSEYHYFTGVSMRKLREMQVLKMNFKAPQINFYGGKVVLNCPEEIAAIIDYLTA
jgi:hypothetical protein